MTAVKLEVEGFIVPRAPTEKVKCTMRPDYRELLNTATAPSFTFWQHQTITRWDITYPILPGSFLTRWPVPAISEVNPSCTNRPNEFQARRLTHDILCKASGGHHLSNLDHFEEWITDSNRKYYTNRTLILPHFNNFMKNVSDTGKSPDPDHLSPAETNNTQRMTLTPLISQLMNTFETREKVASYSGGQFDNTDWSKIEEAEHNPGDDQPAADPDHGEDLDHRPVKGKHLGLKLHS